MDVRNWWKARSGGAKTVTVLTALLILQIGICFGSGFAIDALIPPGPGDEFGSGFGWMALQAFACLLTIALLVIALIMWALTGTSIFGTTEPQRLLDDKNNEEKHD